MAENMIDKINKAQGCLLGQLAGDALGSLVDRRWSVTHKFMADRVASSVRLGPIITSLMF